MTEERRRHPRFPMKQPMDLFLVDGTSIKVRGLNIAEGGMLCRGSRNLPVGTDVMFKLMIPGKESSMTVDCQGSVLWTVKNGAEYDIAVRFAD